MNNNTTNVPYLISTRDFSRDPVELSKGLNRIYVDIANAVNARTIGIFPQNVSAITGETWFLGPNVKYQTIRQVYPFGAIVAGATLTIPHGINNINQFTRIYGTVITTNPDYRPLPYSAVTTTENMELYVDATNINIILGAAASDVASGLVVLEYLTAV